MDGVGGVSAVVAIAQVSFSLAQTLNTYVADVQHGRDDIANLANEIDATVIHVEELDKLIGENAFTNGWNANALNQLRTLFTKTGATVSHNTVTRDDIDISFLNRLTWPSQKRNLEVLKQDLQRVKIYILIALNTYKAHVGTPQSEKDAAAERVAALWRSRIAAQRQLVSIGNPSVARSAMESTGSQRSQYRPQRRAHFADTSRSRPRSRSRQQLRSNHEASRRRQYCRPGSVSSSGDDSPSSRTQQRQQQSQGPSHGQSVEEMPRDVETSGQDPRPGNSRQSSSESSSDHDAKVKDPDQSDPRKLVGVEAKSPQVESLIALFLKSVIGFSEPQSNKFSGKDLLSQAFSHPKEAGRLLSAMSKIYGYNANRSYPQQSAYPYQSPYQPTNVTYGEPVSQSYGVAENRGLVLVDVDDARIDANIPDDELGREVMARYTGAWQMDENGVAHEANDEAPGGAQAGLPPSAVEVLDDGLDMV